MFQPSDRFLRRLHPDNHFRRTKKGQSSTWELTTGVWKFKSEPQADGRIKVSVDHCPGAAELDSALRRHLVQFPAFGLGSIRHEQVVAAGGELLEEPEPDNPVHCGLVVSSDQEVLYALTQALVVEVWPPSRLPGGQATAPL